MSRPSNPKSDPPAKPGRSRLRFALEMLFGAGLLVLAIYRLAPQARAALGANADGTMAPPVMLEMLDGSTTSLAQLRGRVVLVNFWATWCPPCRFEMPGFQKVYEARKADGFVIIGLSADEGPRSHVVDFLRERRITYPVGIATSSAASAFGGMNGLPTSFLIDRKGRIRYRVSGVFTEVALGQAVDRLLAEPK
ncbi:MAG TPA: TlpA disulfide reductase family protein [Longimicrobiales bacterium]